MDLPQLSAGSGRATPLAKKSISAPAMVAKSEIHLAEAAGGLVNQITERAAEHQSKTADADTTFQMTEWSKANDTVQYYSADDLRERGIDEGMIRGRESVPAYEVKPTLFRNESERVVAENAEKIMPGKYRSDFQSKKQNEYFVQQTKRVIESSQEQRKQENLEVISDIERFQQNADYKNAEKRIDDLQAPQHIKDDLLLKNSDDWEYSNVQQIDISKDVPLAQAKLKELYSSYDSETGEFVPEQARTDADRAMNETRTRSAIAILEQMIDNQTEKVSSSTTNFKAEVRDHIKVLVDPKLNVTDPEKSAELLGKAVTILGEDDTLTRALKEEIEWHQTRAEYSGMTKFKQQKWLLEQKDIVNDPDTLYKDRWSRDKAQIAYAKHETAIRENLAYMSKDPVGYHNERVEKLTPIHPDMPADMLKDALAERADLKGVFHDRYGTTNLMSDMEADVWAEKMKEMAPTKPDEVIALAGMITNEFGRDASSAFWEQLELSNFNPGTMGVIGRLASKGWETQAFMVMNGEQILKSDGGMVKDRMDIVIPEIKKHFGSAFTNDKNYKYNKAVQRAAIAVYAFTADRDGEVSGEFDKDRLEDAINHVTNGMYTFQNSIVELPFKVKGGEFQSRFDVTSSEHFDTINGGVLGMDGDDFFNKVKSGDIRMVNVGDNKYQFYDMTSTAGLPLSNGALLMSNDLNDDGSQKPYQYAHDPDAPIDSKAFAQYKNQSALQRWYQTGTMARSDDNLSRMQIENEFDVVVSDDRQTRRLSNMKSNQAIKDEFDAQSEFSSMTGFMANRSTMKRNERIEGRKQAGLQRWRDSNAQ